jgi:hypothetical protein
MIWLLPHPLHFPVSKLDRDPKEDWEREILVAIQYDGETAWSLLII